MDTEKEKLEKIDAVRQRIQVSYDEAREALEKTNYEVLNAVIYLENKRPSVKEQYTAKGSEVWKKVKDLVKEGNVTNIKIVHEGKTLLNLPVTVSLVGVLLAPKLALIGALTGVLTNCTILVERN